jgi:hypothetical protein
MSILADRSAFARMSIIGRGILVASVRDARSSPAALLALSGLPVLAAAWALMSPPTVLSNAMTWDFLFNLSGAWDLYMGHIPHVDFHDPVGQLYFILTAIGFQFLGPGPFAFLIGVAIVVSILFAGSCLAAVRRLPLLPAAIFVVFVCLLALMPTNIGERPDQYTFAMAYNRYCWSAFSILALIVLVPPRNRLRWDWIDIPVGALLLLGMFYLKITYFAVGLATVAFAVLFQPHVGRRWPAWLAVCALVIANAFAPYSQAYLNDILGAAQGGAIQSSLTQHLKNFLAAVGEYAPYFAAFVVACWMWFTGRASLRLPLTIAFLFATSLFLLSQNTQSSGLPSTIVIVLVLYDQLRTHFADARARDIGPLLLALLVFPFFAIGASASSIAGYHAKANRTQILYVVDHTNLRGLAVPAGERGALANYERGGIFAGDDKMRGTPGASVPRYDLSQYEYIETLLEAAYLVAGERDKEQHRSDGIALFDQVNPLPFMLGLRPPRGADLWSSWLRPPLPAEQYLADVAYVLIPKFPTTANWTAALVSHYGSYLDEHFHRVADTPSWIILARRQPGDLMPSNPAPNLNGSHPQTLPANL